MANPVYYPGSQFLSQNYHFPVDSVLPKVFTLIPIVGHFLQLAQERSIREKLDEIVSIEFKIKLMKSQNEYKFAGIARDLLILIAVVATAVLGILEPVGALMLAFGFGAAIGLSCWLAYANHKMIEQVEAIYPLS